MVKLGAAPLLSSYDACDTKAPLSHPTPSRWGGGDATETLPFVGPPLAHVFERKKTGRRPSALVLCVCVCVCAHVSTVRWWLFVFLSAACVCVLQVYSACLLDVDDGSGGGGGGGGGKGTMSAKGKGKGKRTSSSSSSSFSDPPPSSGDGRLFSLKVKLEPPPAHFHARDKDQVPKCPLWGNELVALSSPNWTTTGSSAMLGVVQSWDPVYDQHSKRGGCGVLVRLLVCASSAGGDGVGGRGGWLPLERVRECLGKRKSTVGVPVTLSTTGASLMTACREFQAVMSVSGLPDAVRRCLLDPSVSKEPRRTAAATAGTAHSREVSGSSEGVPGAGVSSGGGGGDRGGGEGKGGAGVRGDGGNGVVVVTGGRAGADDASGVAGSTPPSNVPAKLWESLLRAFNRSQVQAIRKVVEGSPSGFTLLQVRKESGGVLAAVHAGGGGGDVRLRAVAHCIHRLFVLEGSYRRNNHA